MDRCAIVHYYHYFSISRNCRFYNSTQPFLRLQNHHREGCSCDILFHLPYKTGNPNIFKQFDCKFFKKCICVGTEIYAHHFCYVSLISDHTLRILIFKLPYFTLFGISYPCLAAIPDFPPCPYVPKRP